MKIFIDRLYPKKHIIVERMEPYWNQWGHSSTWDLNEADIQLCFGHRQFKTKLPVVQRLDGIHYKGSGKNSVISKLYSNANAVIYQSKFCKLAAEKFLKPRNPNPNDCIIYNGIEPISDTILNRQEKRKNINIFATSVWRRWKRLREITKTFLTALDKTDLPIFLHILGDVKGFKKPKNSNIIFYGNLEYSEIMNYYTVGDVFIHISKNDWCPNSVVESLGFGMPILASTAGGGTVEMLNLGDNLGLLIEEGFADLSKDPYSDEWNKMTPEQLEDGANKLLDLCRRKEKIILPKELHIENTARQYINTFSCVLGEI